ncbi:hypothetical protein HF313_18160 [Massilia atriviolacea]|uniref:Uncharacterized protein n=1 Tax=Massilia atriviolacea TaxID=2495579 RepID=A0A430HTF0_9BURK|nr:hypothetical protein [Massilia atriviolacea]RSZ60790.1 hypothetical protein EJB06_01230 [Massilia atriviolacea]
MRTLFAFFCTLLVIVAPATAVDTVNLDEPSALSRVERDNPAHARSINRILRAAPTMTPGHLAQWLKTSFDAQTVSTQLMKTSDPPQARLSFMLGNTQYKATVTLVSAGAMRVPTG